MHIRQVISFFLWQKPPILITILLLNTLQSTAQWRKVLEEMVVPAPDFGACHASTLAILPGGQVGVAFFAGRYEGHRQVGIRYTVRHPSKAWGPASEVAHGQLNDALQYPCWNPVLLPAQDGVLHLYYKVGPNPREWWGMVQYSRDAGQSWSTAQRLPEGILGPIKNKPVQLANGTILSPSSIETDSTWQAHIEKSEDGGRSWRNIPVNYQSPYKVIQPSLLHHGGSTWQMVCRSNQDSLVAAWSYNDGESWTPYTKLPLQNPNAGADAITLRNGQHLLVYNPGVRGKEWYNNRNLLHVATSTNGIDWQDIIILEKGTTEEFSYPSVVEDSEGKVHITYTYDRKNIKYVVIVP